MNELRHSAKISISPRLTPTTVFKLNLGTAWHDLSIISWEQVTIMICGDFNARLSLWDQHGTNQLGCALEAVLSDVLFTPVTTASPTHPGTRQGDTDSTIDLALVSPKFVPWTRAETLASHGSDHLPVVFSLQKPGFEQKRKLQYPFQYGKSDMGVMSKLRAHKPAHTTNPRQKAAIQPPWWNKETQAAWTDKRTMVKLWQKERSKPHPDLTIKALMEEKTEVFKRVASEAKDRQWKSFCDTLNRDTTLTHFWQFYRQMEGCAANTNTPDLIDASRSVLKTSKEKGSALLQHFVQQSSQNNLDERKAVWEGLDRTLTEAGSNDDMITELEFTKALSGLSKDTAPGPDRVKYSDIKNLSVHNKSELFRLYEESFATGQVPEDRSHSYLKPIPKPGKDHSKLNGYHILTMQNTTGKLMERIVARKLAQDLERRKKKKHMMSMKDSRGRNKLWPWRSIWKMRTTECSSNCWWNSFGNMASAWCSQDGSQQHSRKERLPCDLETGSSRPSNWQGSPLSPVLYNVYTKGLADLNSNGLSRVLTLADDRLIYKTSSDISTAVTAVQEQLEKVSHWCQETESEINPSKAQALWCTLNNKAVGQAMPAVSFNGEAIERTNSLRYLGIHFDRMLTYKMQVKSTKLRCKKGLSALKAMASKGIEQRHLFLLYQSVILSVIDYGVGLTTLSQSNLLKLDRVQNEAMRVILGTTKDTPIETMLYLLDLPSMETRHKVEQVKAYLNAMQNPKNLLHDAVKEEKGCRQEASHGWAKQNNQSSVCAVSQSSSK